jgi:hypothetical protein
LKKKVPETRVEKLMAYKLAKAPLTEDHLGDHGIWDDTGHDQKKT